MNTMHDDTSSSLTEADKKTLTHLNRASADESGDTPQKMVVQKPPDDMLKNNKRGDTDFEMCGWCKYCGSGVETVEYDCFIQGMCSLIPLEVRDEYDWLNVRKFIEYDDDTVIGMTKANFKELLKRFKRQAGQDSTSRKTFKRNLKLLKKMLRKGQVEANPVQGDYSVVLWASPCVIKQCLGNPEFQSDVFARYDAMFELLDEKAERRDIEVKRLHVLRGEKKFKLL